MKMWGMSLMAKLIGALTLFISLSANVSGATEQVNFSVEQCKKNSEVNIHCGNTPSTTFHRSGRLWAVFELNQFVYVNYSDDFGKSYSDPVSVNSIPENIYTNGENRPKIQLGLKDEVYISWNQKTEGRYTGDIRFSRSVDNGKTFSPVITVNDDKLLTGHRFDSLSVAKDGSIYISWIDKRDRFELKNKNQTKTKVKLKLKSTASIYYSYSADSGITFSKNQRVAESTCVCCRIAMIPTQNNQVALLWRHVFNGNIRDHAYAIVDKTGVILPIQRASYDDWEIEACPHHGPSIAEDEQQNKHLVWFTASDKNKGIFYARRTYNENKQSHIINVSNSASASHPYVISNQANIDIVWKQFDGNKTIIMHQRSVDSGISWNTPSVLSMTQGESDHPFLLTREQTVWLSWSTQNEGVRLIKLAS